MTPKGGSIHHINEEHLLIFICLADGYILCGSGVGVQWQISLSWVYISGFLWMMLVPESISRLIDPWLDLDSGLHPSWAGLSLVD